MSPKELPHVQGVGNIDNLVHLWTRVRREQFIAFCDPDLEAQSVDKGEKGDLCPDCVDAGLKVS